MKGSAGRCCATCIYWRKCPTIVPGCEPEMICGKSREGGLGLHGQDGRAIITPPTFCCIFYQRLNPQPPPQ